MTVQKRHQRGWLSTPHCPHPDCRELRAVGDLGHIWYACPNLLEQNGAGGLPAWSEEMEKTRD
eukprot:4581106-Pyramimonas_sp.AAC.1